MSLAAGAACACGSFISGYLMLILMRSAVFALLLLAACAGFEIPGQPEQPPVDVINESVPEQVFCAQDVKECWNGSFVQRVPPQCDFAPCPPEPAPPEPVLVCEDSDVGLNLNKQGTTVYGEEIFSDYCVDSSSVMEYYCQDNKLKSEVKNCGANKECMSGACVVRQAQVYDCMPGSRRCSDDYVEVCDNNGNWKFVSRCEHGCEGGACRTNFCTQEGFRCNDDVLERCNLFKGQWEYVEACKFGCINGQCV